MHRGQDDFKVRLIETSEVRMGRALRNDEGNLVQSRPIVSYCVHAIQRLVFACQNTRMNQKQYELNAHRLLVGYNVELELFPHRRI